jgi:hypothetical protein
VDAAHVSLGLSLDEVFVTVLVADSTILLFVRSPWKEAFLHEISIVNVVKPSLLSLLILTIILIVFENSQAFLESMIAGICLAQMIQSPLFVMLPFLEGTGTLFELLTKFLEFLFESICVLCVASNLR